MKKLSILVPIYNVEKYLPQCLDSLIKQTLKDIEIICINDGSTDGSLEIIKNFAAKNSNIKIIDKQNSGYGDSMNKGLELAQGEFVGIVESDDFVKETMFETLYNLAKANDAQVVKSDYYYYETKTQTARKAGKIPKYKNKRVTNAKEFPQIFKIQPSIWSAIYKRDFLEKNSVKFLPTKGASYQDTSFSFKVFALADKVVLSSDAFLFYRQDNESSSIHSKDKVFAICDEYDEITKFLSQNRILNEFANTPKMLNQYKAYLWNLKRLDQELQPQFLEVFSKTFENFMLQKLLSDDFFAKYSKKEINLLINEKEKYLEKVRKENEKQEAKRNRKKLFSIRINSSRISIILFGKHILEVG